MAERGYLLVREDDAEAKSAETRRAKEGRARPAIYRRRRLQAAPSRVEADGMSKTLKEVIVAFLLTFDRGWDSTEQAHRDLLNDLDKAGFVIAPKEPTPEILAIADATALLQLTEDIEDRANCGPLASLREIFRFERLRGGGCSPDRTGLNL